MLPTAVFSIRNSYSPTGSTLTDASCESESSTLSLATSAPASDRITWRTTVLSWCPVEVRVLSESNSLVTGKITGNSAESVNFQDGCGWLLLVITEIATPANSEFFCGNREFELHQTGRDRGKPDV